MQRIAKILTCVVILLFFNQLSADNSVRANNHYPISRYVNIAPEATQGQKNPLKGVIQHVNFHRNIKYVGQAIRDLLKTSGYRLAPHHPDPRIHRMLSLQLPAIHRNMGPLTLENALEVLAGEPWMLSVDPINRFISFELPGLYQLKVNASHYNKHVSKPLRAGQRINVKKRVQKKYVNRKIVKRVATPKIRKYKSNVARTQNKNEKRIFNLTWSELPEEWKK